MNDVVMIDGAGGHHWRAFRAEPLARPRGAVIVIQEIFGITGFVRDYARQWAEAGYFVLAPALFDPLNSGNGAYGLELGYDAAGVAQGRALRTELGWELPVQIIAHTMRAAADAGPVAVVGFCWGGSLAFLSATRLNPCAAIAYYGGQIHDFRDEKPSCPVMCHFGENDPLIPQDHCTAITAAQPQAVIHHYPAGHGFACSHRDDFHPSSAALAWQRDLAFVSAYMPS